jgi:hypothetical protein
MGALDLGRCSSILKVKACTWTLAIRLTFYNPNTYPQHLILSAKREQNRKYRTRKLSSLTSWRSLFLLGGAIVAVSASANIMLTGIVATVYVHDDKN